MEQVFFQEKNQWWWYQVVVIGANSIPTVIAVWGGMKKETSVSANSSIVLQLNYEAAAQLWGGLGMRWPWSEAPLWLDSAAVFPSCLLCLLCLQSVPLCTRPVRWSDSWVKQTDVKLDYTAYGKWRDWVLTKYISSNFVHMPSSTLVDCWLDVEPCARRWEHTGELNWSLPANPLKLWD